MTQLIEQQESHGGSFGDSIVFGRNCMQHWVLCKFGMTSNHHLIANPSSGSGWTNKSQL